MKRKLKSVGFSSFLSSLLAILVGLLFGFIILLISNPKEAVQGFGIILSGRLRGRHVRPGPGALFRHAHHHDRPVRGLCL